jgi:hypothetical protein
LEQFGDASYIDAESLSQGLYVVKIYQAQQQLVFKFIKE